jgi:biopolymer transport protein ExbD
VVICIASLPGCKTGVDAGGQYKDGISLIGVSGWEADPARLLMISIHVSPKGENNEGADYEIAGRLGRLDESGMQSYLKELATYAAREKLAPYAVISARADTRWKFAFAAMSTARAVGADAPCFIEYDIGGFRFRYLPTSPPLAGMSGGGDSSAREAIQISIPSKGAVAGHSTTDHDPILALMPAGYTLALPGQPQRRFKPDQAEDMAVAVRGALAIAAKEKRKVSVVLEADERVQFIAVEEALRELRKSKCHRLTLKLGKEFMQVNLLGLEEVDDPATEIPTPPRVPQTVP